jgi:hypothetical protein
VRFAKASCLWATSAALSLLCGGVRAWQEAQSFDAVFHDVPASFHYRAEYEARGARHTVEAWVDQGVRLKRVTDGQVEAYAVRASASEPEYRMTVLDLQRRIATRIDRTNLFRIGNFTDWFELAHALRHPRGGYALAPAEAPAGAGRPVAACEWYRLEQDGHASTVCWNHEAGLPLSVVAENGREAWRVTSLQLGPVPAQEFVVRDAGFVRNDANGDIERD